MGAYICIGRAKGLHLLVAVSPQDVATDDEFAVFLDLFGCARQSGGLPANRNRE